MNIVLIGFRGSGKSSIGRRLASKLWLDFIDTDVLVSERAQMTIREIFQAEGEEGFRQRESQVIAEVAARDRLVIAAGGGAVLRPENVAAAKQVCQGLSGSAFPRIRCTSESRTIPRPMRTAPTWPVEASTKCNSF